MAAPQSLASMSIPFIIESGSRLSSKKMGTRDRKSVHEFMTDSCLLNYASKARHHQTISNNLHKQTRANVKLVFVRTSDLARVYSKASCPENPSIDEQNAPNPRKHLTKGSFRPSGSSTSWLISSCTARTSQAPF